MTEYTSAELWRLQYEAIYAGHKWPDGTLISICREDPNRGIRFRAAGFAAVGNSDAIWNKVSPLAQDGQTTYISVGGLDGSLINAPAGGRGTAADVVGLPALIADLDTTSGEHAPKRLPLPTDEQVMAWLAELPVKPTVVVKSGGGFHIWVALSELLLPGAANHMAILAAWKDWWVARAARDQLHIDVGVLADVGRVLRPVGTVNAKQQGRSVELDLDRSDLNARYSLDVIRAAFPPRVALAASEFVTPTPAAQTRSSDSQENQPERIGDRFAVAVSASLVMTEVFNAIPEGSTGLIFPRPDGTYGDSANVRVYGEAITVFGERVKEEWASYGALEPHSWDSFQILALVGAAGDFKAAAKALSMFAPSDWPHRLPEIFATAVGLTSSKTSVMPARTLGGTGPLSAVVAPAVPPIGTEVDAIQLPIAMAGDASCTVTLDGGLRVVVGGHNTGLMRKVKSESGQYLYIPVAPYVIWKRSKTSHYSVTETGEPQLVSDPTYEVEIRTAFGMRRSQQGFTAEQAHSPREVLDRLDPGVGLPIDAADVKRISNMIRQLGNGQGTVEYSEFHKLGWMRDENAWVFLMPSGSIDANGIRLDYTVGPPAGSDVGALQPAIRQAGFDRIPTDLRSIGRAINAFLEIAPGRRDVLVALLGALFAAPLALSRRTTVLIAGKPGTAKSLLASAVQAFFSAVGIDGASFAMTLGRGTTRVATEVTTAYMRHGLAVFDDFRFVGVPRDDQMMLSSVTGIVQGVYGADGAGRGTRDGGLRAAHGADCVAIITAETVPTQEAIVSRVVPFELRPGEVVIEPRGGAPIDEFKRSWGDTGAARSLYAAYIQWLAIEIEKAGGLTAFRRTVDERKKSWTSTAVGRAAETTSTLAVGWRMFREFAADSGIEDLIPDAEEIDQLLDSIANSASQTVAEVNHGRRIIETARDMINGGTGYVQSCTRGMLENFEKQTGWDWVGNGEYGRWDAGHKLLVGVLSSDRRYIVLPNEAVRAIQRDLGLAGLNSDQIRRSFEDLVVPGSTPGGQASTTMKIQSRPRGYVLPVSVFDLDFELADLSELGYEELATGE